MRASYIAVVLLLTCVLHGPRASAQSNITGKIWHDFKDKFAGRPKGADAAASAPGVLRLDCSTTKDRVITASLWLPAELLEPLKGRRLILQLRAMRIRGEGQLRVRMRCFSADGFLLAGQKSVFTGKQDQWQRWECHCVIPPLEDVRRVDFLLALDNSPNPPAVVIDSCLLKEAAAATGYTCDIVAARSGADDLPLTLTGTRRVSMPGFTERPASFLVRFRNGSCRTAAGLRDGL